MEEYSRFSVLKDSDFSMEFCVMVDLIMRFEFFYGFWGYLWWLFYIWKNREFREIGFWMKGRIFRNKDI